MKVVSTETKLGGQIIEEWKLMEDDEALHVSECDCCGLNKVGCIDLVYMGMDTHACPECRGHSHENY